MADIVRTLDDLRDRIQGLQTVSNAAAAGISDTQVATVMGTAV